MLPTPSDPDEFNIPNSERPVEEQVSRSQRKRDADDVSRLALQISELSPTEIARLPLETPVRDALGTLKNVRAHGARKRQLGYVAKLLRQSDLTPVMRALAELRRLAAVEQQLFHQIEQWRDRLLDGDGEALAEFLATYPDTDRQQLRQLQRSAQRERATDQPPKATRQLFKFVREILLRTVSGQ